MTTPASPYQAELSQGRALLEGQLGKWPLDAWRVVDIPMPPGPVEHLWDEGAGPAALWGGRDGARFATWGVARRLVAHGPGRFAQIRQEATSVRHSLLQRRSPAPAMAWVGGAAFAAGAPRGAWREFGEATFTLPRWRYWVKGARAWLSCCAAPGETAAEFLGELAEIEGRLARPSFQGLRLVSQGLTVHQMSKARWAEGVEAALRALQRGSFDKLVLARVAKVEGRSDFDVREVVAALAQSPFKGTLFAFREAHSAFVGLTPERLVQLKGRAVDTEALAGTAAKGEGAALRLQQSVKDRHEHDLVVGDLRRRLAPFCHSVAPSGPPASFRSGDILHLKTPLEGRLARPAHILELVEALHPTPAVAGLPAAAAIAWVGAHEAEPRGWYAGPVGWFNARGQGDFAVAIRSALISGARARVFSGAGIVAGSSPDTEYAETALKQRSMLAALGAGG